MSTNCLTDQWLTEKHTDTCMIPISSANTELKHKT